MRKHRNSSDEESVELCPACSGSIEPLYTLNPKVLWAHVKTEHISFWFLCIYFFFEYVRPQSIVPALDILPWAQLSLIFTLITWVLDTRRSFHWSAVFFWILVFNAVCVLSATQAYYPAWSWDNLNLVYLWAPIFYLTVCIVNTRERFLLLLLLLLLASFKLSFHGARTWAERGFSFSSWGLKGPPGYFENSGELAIQMLIFTPLAFQLGIACKPRVGKWMYRFLNFAALTGAMTIMGASSRGAQVSMAFQLLYIFFRNSINVRNVVSVVILAAIAYGIMPDEQIARFTEVGEDKTSLQRLLYWEHGIEMIREHPWLGVGFFNYIPYYTDYYPADILFKYAELPHNIFIQVGTDTGYIGLAVYILLIWLGLRNVSWIVKQAPADAVCFDALIAKGLAAGMWGFVLAGQFVSVAYYPFLWIQLALIVALRQIVEKNGNKSQMMARRGR